MLRTNASFKFDDEGNLIRWYGQPILLDSSIPRDPKALLLLDKYRPAIDKLSAFEVGLAKSTLDANCRMNECNFGNLAADAFVYNRVQQYHGPFWTDASIALLNSGGIRASAPVGNISAYHIMTMLPFNNTLLVLNVTGHMLKLVLEKSVEWYGGNGNFFQMSGIQVTFDLSKKVNQRVESVKVLCNECDVPAYEELDIDKQYGIIITSYLYGSIEFEIFQVRLNLQILSSVISQIENNFIFIFLFNINLKVIQSNPYECN